MASPAELDPNLPETLPADFGEWDSSDSQAPPPAEPPKKPQDSSPRETAQRESARREAEAIDFAKKPSAAREVSREFELQRDLTPFSEADEAPVAPRGIPAPVIRAPRTSPAPPPVPSVPSPTVQDESPLKRRLNAVETIVDKKPEIEVSKEEPTPSTVSLFESKPNQPLFSSVATEESSEEETRTTLLNDLLDDHEERKTRRKWITTACVFGGALLLVVFQLIHYTSAAKIKHIVNTPQPAVSSPEPDTVTDAILNSKLAASKPSAAKPNSETQPQPQPEQVESASVKSPDKVPAASQTRLMETQLAAPTRLPQNAKSGAAGDAPPPSSLGGASMAALSGNNAMGSVFSAGSNAKVSGPRVVSVSAGVAVGMLVHQTPALYPPIAKSARVQGTVVLNATISKTGKVTNVRVLSGPPMLRQSAIDAVKTWQYKPYMLNNEPTDAETTINVAFSLGG